MHVDIEALVVCNGDGEIRERVDAVFTLSPVEGGFPVLLRIGKPVSAHAISAAGVGVFEDGGFDRGEFDELTEEVDLLSETWALKGFGFSFAELGTLL